MERYSNENQQLLNDSYRRLDKIAEEIRGYVKGEWIWQKRRVLKIR